MNLGISFCAESDVRLRWLRKTARSRLFRDRKDLNEGVRQLVAVCAADRRGMGTALLPCYEDGADDVLRMAATMPTGPALHSIWATVLMTMAMTPVASPRAKIRE